MNPVRFQSRAGIGISSVLMVLVVLAMAALSMLAFSGARDTESMTRRNVEVSVAYYENAAQVQRRLMLIDQAALDRPGDADSLKWYQSQAIDGVEWSREADGVHFTITLQNDQKQGIVAQGVMLEGQFPRYRLLSHKLSNHTPEEDEGFLNLIGESNNGY